MRVFKNAWFERFARKNQISDKSLLDAIHRAEQGLIDADLGGGVIKQRIARDGEGKSGGFRTIVLYKQETRAFFMFGFAKNAQGNIKSDERAEFKKAAKHVLGLSDTHIEAMIRKGQFSEVVYDKEVPK